MKLVGMLDSPYVRRVAISFDVLGIDFEHRPVSVFNDLELFKSINPVVKAPTLVLDDGKYLMDSSVILQFIEKVFPDKKSLWGSVDIQKQFRLVSLALAACDKSVQYVYETNLRPPASQHQPWLERVLGQILAALDDLEAELSEESGGQSPILNQANITVGVVWSFIQSMLSDKVTAANYPYLDQLGKLMEAIESFKKFPPLGPGINEK